MADNQMVKIVFDFDLGNVPASAKKLSQYLKDNNLDLKFTKKSVDDLAASMNQLSTAQTKAAQAGAAAGNSIKKSNMQWTNLALVIQDLPYGFRGIQNNLPALMGGIAGMAGPLYLVGSAIIALFTAWDNGAFSATKSTNDWRKALKETNDEIRNTVNYTSSEISNLRGLVDVMLDVNTTESIRNKALLEAKEAITKVDEAQGKKIKTIGDAIIAINLYSEAIQQQQMQEVIGKKIAEISIGQIEKRNRLAIETAKANKGIHPIDFFMGNTELDNLNSEIIANETLLRQLEDLRKSNTKALLLNPYSPYNAKKGKTGSAKQLEDPSIALLQAKQKYYKDDLLMFASYEQEILGKQRDLAVKQAEVDKKSKGDIKIIRDTFNQLILNSQAETGKRFIESGHKLGIEEAKEHEKVAQMILATRFDLASAIAKINEDFANEDIKNVKAELSSTLKATRGRYYAQKDAIQLAIDKLSEYKIAAKEAGSESTKFDEAIKELGFSMDGLVDPLEQMKLNIEKTFDGLATDTLAELGTQLGNVLSGGEFSMEGFMDLLANALISIGKHLVLVSGLFAAVDKLFKNPSTWPLAIAAGVAAIAAGTAMKNNAAKRNPVKKFADGGIISGPTMGLMGEYPGAKSNPEVVAPLDKLKDMIGGGGGGTFMLRGQDLLLSVNRAQKASNLKGQNISLA